MIGENCKHKRPLLDPFKQYAKSGELRAQAIENIIANADKVQNIVRSAINDKT